MTRTPTDSSPIQRHVAAPPRRILQWTLFAAPVAVFLGTGWAHRWVAEDGFIYLRVVQQVRAGNGPVFNPGERVEAFTGPLWVGILSVADLLAPLRLEWIAVMLGLASAAPPGIAFMTAGARRLWGAQADAALVRAARCARVRGRPSRVGLCDERTGDRPFLRVARRLPLDPRRLGTTSRPNPLSCCAVVLGLGWVYDPSSHCSAPRFHSSSSLVLELWSPAAAAGARGTDRDSLWSRLPLAYQIFRMGYYGNLVPNTAIAKEGSSTNFDRGWQYFTDFVDPYWLWIPALALLAGGYLPLGAVLARAGRRRACGSRSPSASARSCTSAT